MSNIDERVVVMKFDNSNFESNTKQTMSTLDKLKEKLNFSGSSKGLENLNSTANKVNLNGLNSSIEQVHNNFSAMEVIGITALQRITNAAIDAGLSLTKSLTIEPVSTGFSEYELKMDSVKTIMYSTGESIDVVNEYLDDLNTYADKTIYSFKDMTANIGKFTNAGVSLDKAVTAMKGLSNEAALSGASTEQASRAMYNFSQALSMGYVQLIDWKSIENANMATVEFKNQLLNTAVALGVVNKTVDDTYETSSGVYTMQQMFKDGLQDQWLTTDVLIDTLNAYGDETTEIGKKAYAAAGNVSTFSQMISVLKETAQSGWAQTWETIIGDYNTATSFFTTITNFISGIIDGFADLRNNFLNSFLGRGFTDTIKTVSNAVNGVKESVEGVTTALKTAADYTNVVGEIIQGKWGNGQSRWDALTAAGYDWAHAQNLVNEQLGVALRRETSYTEAVESTTDAVSDESESIKTLTHEQREQLKTYMKMSDAELKNLGFTDKQIESFRELKNIMDMTGMSLKKLLNNAEEINGRWLIFDSFKNIGNALTEIFKTVGNAFKTVFAGTGDKLSNAIFNIIMGFHKFSEELKRFVGTAEEPSLLLKTLTVVFKGLFSAIKLVIDIVGGALSIVFNTLKIAIKTVLSLFGKSDVDLSHYVDRLSEIIDKTNKWISEHNVLGKIIEKVQPHVVAIINNIANWIKNNEKLNQVLQTFKNLLKSAFSGMKEWIKGLETTDDIPKYLFEGLKNGFLKGLSGLKTVLGLVATTIIEVVKGILGIHSPSTVFFDIGQNIIQGLINGIKSLVGNLGGIASFIVQKITDAFHGINWSAIIGIGITAGVFVIVNKLANIFQGLTIVLENLTAPLKGLGNFFSGFGSYMEDAGEAEKLKAKADMIKSIALLILSMAGTVYLLGNMDRDALIQGGIALAALAGVTIILIKVAGKVNELPSLDKSVTVNLLLIAACMALLAKTLVKLSEIDPSRLESTIISYVGLIAGLAALTYAMGALTEKKGNSAKKIDAGAKLIKQLAKSLLIIAVATKIMAGLTVGDIAKSVIIIGLVSALYYAFTKMSKGMKGATNADKVGIMMLAMSASFILIAKAIKKMGKLSVSDIAKGLVIIAGVTAMMALLVAMSKFSGENASKAGSMILKVAISLSLIAVSMKIISKLKEEDIDRSIAVVGALSIFIAGIIAISKFSGEYAARAAALILSVSGSLFVMVAALGILTLLPEDKVWTAVTVLGAIIVMIDSVLLVSSYAGKIGKDSLKPLIVMAVSLGILIAAIIAFTFIDQAKLITACTGLALVIAAFSGALYATTQIKFSKKQLSRALIAMGAMTLVVAALAGIIVLMSKLQSGSALANATALSELLIAMTSALAVLSKIKVSIKSVASAAAGLALLGLVLEELALVLASMSALKVQDSIANATALSLLLIVMSGVMVVLAVVGSFSGTILPGIACLAILALAVEEIALVLATMTALNVQNGIENATALSILLVAMSASLILLGVVGAMGPAAFIGVAALITLVTSFTALAVAIGALDKYWDDFETLLDKGIPLLVKIAKGMGQVIGAFVEGIASSLLDILPDLGLKLSMFMTNATGFILGAKLVDDATVKGVGLLVSAIYALIGANFLDGITKLFTFGKSFDHLGTTLSKFAIKLIPFFTTMKAVDSNVLKTTRNLANVILTLTKANLVDSIAKFMGSKSNYQGLADALGPLGEGVAAFSDKIKDIPDDALDKSKIASQILLNIAKMASDLPNEGGKLAELIGDNTLGQFVTYLSPMATALGDFNTTISGIEFNEDKMNVAFDALKQIINLAKEIPNEGGLLAAFQGDNTFTNLGTGMTALGTALVSFNDSLSGTTFDEAKLSSALTLTEKMIEVSHNIDNQGGFAAVFAGDNTLANLGDDLGTLGAGLKKFYKNIKDIDTGETLEAAKACKNVAIALKELSTVNSDAIANFNKNLSDLGNTSIENFATAFKKNSSSKLKSIKSDLGTLLDGITDTLSGYYTNFKKAGKHLTTGFADGIKANEYKATAAGKEIANAAYKAAKKALDEHSPSKKMAKVGAYAGQGFVNGLSDYVDKSYNASSEVANSATDGMSSAISKMSDLFNNSLDANPTITPVLDLSNVNSGLGYLNGLFGTDSIGVTSNLGAISTGMANSQNGTANDIITAIDGLRKDLGNISGDTYNVNGVTYDDGSNITDAVRTLVRAAKVERRI